MFYLFSFCFSFRIWCSLLCAAPAMKPLIKVKARRCHLLSAEDEAKIFSQQPRSPVAHINLPDSPCSQVCVFFSVSHIHIWVIWYLLSFYFLLGVQDRNLLCPYCFYLGETALQCRFEVKTITASSTGWIKNSSYSCSWFFPQASCGMSLFCVQFICV
jgi:hypothetical protein